MPGLAVFPLHIPAPPNFKLPPGNKVDGEVNPIELVVLCYFCSLLKPKRVFEIGTFRGRTTLGMAMNMGGGKVFTLDMLTPPDNMTDRDRNLMLPYNEIGAVYRSNNDYAPDIIQLYGDSKRFNFAPYHGQMDLIFIDGSHDFWSTLFDLYHAKQMITETGTIICHDCADWEKGVTDAVNVFWQQYDLVGIRPEGTSLACFGKGIIDTCFPH